MSAHKPARTLWHQTLHPQFIRSSFSGTHLPAQRVQGPQQPQAESWQWPVQNDCQQLILLVILELAKVCITFYILSTIGYCCLQNTLFSKVKYNIAEKTEFMPRFNVIHHNVYLIDLPHWSFSGPTKQSTVINFLLSGGTLKPWEDVLQWVQAECTQLSNDDGF